MTGDVVLALPHDASFQLNATVSDKNRIVSDFKLTYLSEVPPPKPPATPKDPTPVDAPKAPAKKQPPAKGGPVVAPIVVEKPSKPTPYVLRRFNAVCGSGGATISVASFGGTVRLKKI
jgi:hypothetical protein